MTSPEKTQALHLKLHPNDSVSIVLKEDGLDLGKGIIPKGHKFANHQIEEGEPVFKYGHLIGISKSKILINEHIHTHNLRMPKPNENGDYEKAFSIENTLNLKTSYSIPDFFKGYKRSTGRAGTRNYIAVVASVNCSSTVVKAICRQIPESLLKEKNIDGVIPITHAEGCAQAIGGQEYQILNRTLAGWAFHPNTVAAVVIGLGCEGTTFETILNEAKKHNLQNDIPLKHFKIQEIGGTKNAIDEGVKTVNKLIDTLPRFERTRIPLSELCVALNCGGSDAFSGITGNPALGFASDLLTKKGATVALAEIPECHGAEDLLINRCLNTNDQDRLKKLFVWWQDYSQKHGVTLNENLAPGNISGGITTILEKSLGAVAKGGTGPVTQVLGYSEKITQAGLVIMNTPGFDPVSVTGLVAGGCNLVAFTTGRGSVYGCAISPTLKIATTTRLFKQMSDDMDFNAGVALETGSIEQTGYELCLKLIEIASGTPTFSETLKIGFEEFAPWPVGETL